MAPEAPGGTPGALNFDPSGHPPKPPGRSALRWPGFRALSDRTPLRTKLITAVLALVALALVAISVASVVVLRSYLVQQHDDDIKGVIGQINATGTPPAN